MKQTLNNLPKVQHEAMIIFASEVLTNFRAVEAACAFTFNLDVRQVEEFEALRQSYIDFADALIESGFNHNQVTAEEKAEFEAMRKEAKNA